ncbi:MAG: hypothetical protein JSV84_13445 [Gemmatimonadota bacterium]|nr:MAG: hypothetical protein JSV84_13445 [Gemmatimonadota bacterium]
MASKILANMFDTLVNYERGKFFKRSALAESLRVNSEGTIWTFYLRRGITFHDGTSFNAEAVKISFDRQMNPETDFYLTEKNVYGGSTLSMIERIDILDEFTVRFQLHYPYAPFYHTLANCFGASIISPSALRKFGPEFGKHPVGTGPFRLASWKEGKSITLVAHETYWGGPPKIDRVEFVIVPQSIDRVEKMLDGSLDIIEDVGATLIDKLYLKQDVELIYSEDLGVHVLGFNCQQKPFNDPRVRKAVALAFDKEKFVHTMLRGKGLVASSPLPPALGTFSSLSEQLPYDPVAAQKLLAQAGYTRGFSVDLWCYCISERAGVLPLAIKKNLKKIDIQVNIKYYEDWDEYNRGVMRGEASLFVDGWRGNIVDPDGFLYPIFHSRARKSGGNLFHYSNASFDQLLEEARRTMNEPTRMMLYDEALRIIVSDLPCLFISFSKETFALRSCIEGFSVNPLGIVRLNNVEYVPL